MKKKIITAVSTLALISLLAGCFPTGKKPAPVNSGGGVNAGTDSGGGSTNSGANGGSFDEGEWDIQLPENLSLEMEQPQSTPSELPEITLSLRKWDQEEMERIFLEGKEMTEELVNDADKFPNEKLYYYETNDGFRLIFQRGQFMFDDTAMLDNEFKYGHIYFLGTPYGAPPFESGEDLAAFTQKEARSRVEPFLDKLGITNYGEPIVVPIKADFANQILARRKEVADLNGTPFDYTPWTTDEEIYVLHYPLVYEGVELTMDSISLQQEEAGTYGSEIIAAVAKDKLINLTAWDIYDESYDATEKIALNYDYPMAVRELKQYFSNQILQWPETYKDSKVIYVPYHKVDYTTFTFKPAWDFAGYSEDDSIQNRAERHQIFYADTGMRYKEG